MGCNLIRLVYFLSLILSVACVVAWVTELHTNGISVKIILFILKTIVAALLELGKLKK